MSFSTTLALTVPGVFDKVMCPASEPIHRAGVLRVDLACTPTGRRLPERKLLGIGVSGQLGESVCPSLGASETECPHALQSRENEELHHGRRPCCEDELVPVVVNEMGRISVSFPNSRLMDLGTACQRIQRSVNGRHLRALMRAEKL